MEPATERTGVMVLRAWTESERASLRIRITSTVDVTTTDESVRVVATSDEACEVVRAWLNGLLGTTTAGIAEERRA